jgi:hypothetical protein
VVGGEATASEVPVPSLNTAFDIECISEEAYERKIDKFPNADHLRDQVIGISALFYVHGQTGGGGVFLRVSMTVCSVVPLPNTIAYTFDTEKSLLLSFRNMCVDLCDVDNLTGYNSLGFDMPYLFKGAVCIHRVASFYAWNRFVKDACRAPWSWRNAVGTSSYGGGLDKNGKAKSAKRSFTSLAATRWTSTRWLLKWRIWTRTS